MKTIPPAYLATAVACGALAVAAAVFVPTTMVDKLGALLEHVARDPAGATVIVSILAGAITTLRAAWVRRPPDDPPPPPAPPPPPDDDERRERKRPLRVEAKRLSLALALALLPGCGASALQTHASIAVGLEASLGVSRGLIAPACDVSLTACHGDQQCIDGVAHDCRGAVAAWEVTHAAVLGYVEALQAASLADDGAVLDALAMVLATTARTWAATVAALATVGVTLPAIPDAAAPLLAAIGGGR